jgi:hypothetical protein
MTFAFFFPRKHPSAGSTAHVSLPAVESPAPLQGATGSGLYVRWRRFAPPPATVLRASGARLDSDGVASRDHRAVLRASGARLDSDGVASRDHRAVLHTSGARLMDSDGVASRDHRAVLHTSGARLMDSGGVASRDHRAVLRLRREA